MKLFNQMSIAVSIIIISILAFVMGISYQSTKNDMLQGVYETSVNNIATLAGTLAATDGDEAIISSSIDAAFDSGYYKRIEFVSSQSDFAYKQENKKRVATVPEWFVAFANVENRVVSEDVISGWQTLGRVSVVGDSDIIYQSLYKTFIKLLYLFIGATAASLLLLGIMLTYILKPLKLITKQAEAITRDEFFYQEKIPFTTEFKELVRGMNLMVKKVEYIFAKGSETLKRNQELMYVDDTTQLYNRRYLLLKLPDLIGLENRVDGGSFVFLGITGAEILNQSLGRATADRVFSSIGEILQKAVAPYEDALAVRANGTEFILVIPNTPANKAFELAKEIHKQYTQLLEKHSISVADVELGIGLYFYQSDITVSELLTKADSALTHAKADEINSIYVYEEANDENAMGKEQWREIIEESISKKKISLKFWPMLDVRDGELNYKVMSFSLDESVNKQYFYGDFIAPAINLGLVSKVYQLALERLFTAKHEILKNKICSVRFSNEFIKDPQSYEILASLLKAHVKNLDFKIAFELSDGFVVRNPMLVKRFVDLFKAHGCIFGINSFTGESDNFDYLKLYNPSFIKADVSFLLDQTKDSMGALMVISNTLGMRVIATSVATHEQLDALKSLGIYNIQGPIVDKIEQ